MYSIDCSVDLDLYLSLDKISLFHKQFVQAFFKINITYLTYVHFLFTLLIITKQNCPMGHACENQHLTYNISKKTHLELRLYDSIAQSIYTTTPATPLLLLDSSTS